MKNLFYRLIIFLDTAQENDTNYNIAWFMANNFYRIANMRISELAAECFVSPATISRFCRALGYENFAHLKQECYTFHSHDKKFNNLINIPLETMKEHPQLATQQYIQQVIQYISDLPEFLDWNEVDAILKLIHDSDSVAFFWNTVFTKCSLAFTDRFINAGKIHNGLYGFISPVRMCQTINVK